MKQTTFLIWALSAAAIASAHAETIHVDDTYVGNLPTRGKPQTDRIGSSFFEVSGADLIFEGHRLTVKINTPYDAAATKKTQGTTWGDLFLNTDGDAAWDYVVDTSSGKIRGGNFRTYISNDLNDSRYTFRDKEVVAYKSGGIFIENADIDLSHAGSYVSYGFDYTALGLNAGDHFGFRWASTCANDIIQGEVAVPVPEPETYALLGIGLVGLAASRRARSKRAA